MHGEELVVGLCLDQVSLRRQQLQADQGSEKPPYEKEKSDRHQVKPGDALVVSRQEPGFEAVVDIEIVFTALGFDGIHL